MIIEESSFERTFGGNSTEYGDLLSKWYQKENDKISAFALSPDGKTLLAGTESGRIAVFSTEGKKLLNTLSFRNSAISDINFQKDSTHFVTASKEGKVVVWDAKKPEPLFSVDGHDSAVSAAFFCRRRQTCFCRRGRTSAYLEKTRQRGDQTL